MNPEWSRKGNVRGRGEQATRTGSHWAVPRLLMSSTDLHTHAGVSVAAQLSLPPHCRGSDWLLSLGNCETSSLEILSRDEKSRNIPLFLHSCPIQLGRKFSLFLLWTAVRGHSLESLWHTDVPRDATGSSRSLWGQCAPHTSKGLNPTEQVYFSFYKSNWKNLTIIMIFSILAVFYFEEML